jgi:phosphodiesterase/alkaline phosphatase D-like protein
MLFIKSLNVSNNNINSSRFSSIAWSEMACNPSFTHGLIAGGMNDGHVHLWDPSKLTDGGPVEIIASVEQHQGK